jgi:hypothetical protein
MSKIRRKKWPPLQGSASAGWQSWVDHPFDSFEIVIAICMPSSVLNELIKPFHRDMQIRRVVIGSCVMLLIKESNRWLQHHRSNYLTPNTSYFSDELVNADLTGMPLYLQY